MDEEINETQQVEPAQEATPNGVLIQIQHTERGRAVVTGVTPLGDVRESETPDILERAMKVYRSGTGLD